MQTRWKYLSSGGTSRLILVFYKDGEIVKSGYAFPDDVRKGVDDFLGNYVV